MTLYRCTPMSANISREQCEKNQAKCFSCLGCPGLGEAVPTYPLSAVQEEVEVSKKKVEPCVMCHRTMEIAGRGMCGKCYSVELKREKASKSAPPLKPVESVLADSGFKPAKAAVTVPEPVEAVTEQPPGLESSQWRDEIVSEPVEAAEPDIAGKDQPTDTEWEGFEPDTERETEHLLGCAQDISENIPSESFADAMRGVLADDDVYVTVPQSLADAWGRIGLGNEHVLGLMELHLNGELMIRRYL